MSVLDLGSRISDLKCGATILLALAAHVRAATLHVATNSPSPAPPYATWSSAARSVQDAIDAAADGDTVLVSNGVYRTGGATVPGHTLINRACVARPITVHAVHGPATATLEGAGGTRCAYLGPGAVLSGFTLTEGRTRTGGGHDAGAAGALLEPGAIVSNCVITGNAADRSAGGLLFNGGGTASGCTICSNSAGSTGGGVYCSEGGTLSNCVIDGNNAETDGGGIYMFEGGRLVDSVVVSNAAAGNGGGLCISGSGSAEACDIEGNRSLGARGGGVYLNAGGILTACTLSGNTAMGNGGGIYCHATGSVDRCVVNRNTTLASGGGMYCASGGEVTSCLLVDNTANWYAGGVYCSNGGMVRSSTICDNRATWAGGVHCKDGGGVINSIVLGNAADVGAQYLSNGGTITFCVSDPAPGPDCLTVDPLFVDRSNGNYRIQGGSPCVNAGTNEPWMLSAFDLEGQERVTALVTDIGAYESPLTNPPILTVTTPAGSLRWQATNAVVSGLINQHVVGRLSWSNALNGAWGTASATSSWWSIPGIPLAPGDNVIAVTVTNAQGVARTDRVTIYRGNPLYVRSDSPDPLAPYATWDRAARTIQDAVDAARPYDAVIVTNGVYDAGGAVLPGLTASNRVCVTKPLSVSSVNGPKVTRIAGTTGSVRCAYLTNGAVLCGFTLTNGHARLVPGAAFDDRAGGGAFLDDGGVVSNCILTACSAVYGGGVYGTGSSAVGGSLVIGCTALTSGGGVYAANGATVTSCTICDNTATWAGGVQCEDGASIVNTIVRFNNAAFGPDYRNSGGTFAYCATTPAEGAACVTAPPLFEGRPGGDYRLRAGSPCVNAGTNAAWMFEGVDLDGHARIVAGVVDIGAYECTRTNAPVLAITTPDGRVRWDTATIDITGTNNEYVVGHLRWSNTLNGAYGTVSAERTWRIAGVPLAAGDNAIAVTGTNAQGVARTDSVAIRRGRALYVWADSPSPQAPYATWSHAAHAIQDAVDAGNAHDTVVVTNGTYHSGGAVAPRFALTNRVCVTKPLGVFSVNGPEATRIAGANGTRCAYLADGAVLCGFTLTNGHAAVDVHAAPGDRMGGGVFLDKEGIVSNCVIAGNSAILGGGVYCRPGGTVSRCVVAGNTAFSDGGGVFCASGGKLSCSLLFANEAASHGGGVYCATGGTVRSCTICDNTAAWAGGVRCKEGGTVANSIIRFNTAGGGPQYQNAGGTFSHCATEPALGEACVTDAPMFLDRPGRDYRLRGGSPCVNAGKYETWMAGALDLDGGARIRGGITDIGAYETPLDSPPVITVTTPPTCVDWGTTTHIVEGTLNRYVVGRLLWTNSLNGTHGTAPASYWWTIHGIPLAPGDNPITVTAANAQGVARSDSVTIHRGSALRVWADSPDPQPPYTTWEHAAHAIQDAVAAARPFDAVVVTNGVYDTGGAVAPSLALTNRVCITNRISVRSVSGPSSTFIVGAATGVRCAYVSEYAVLSGFTLTNGHASVDTRAPRPDRMGGGVLLHGGGELSNCIVVGNSASYGGGIGCYGGGWASHCIISGNSATIDGGGACSHDDGWFHNCLITGNNALWRGGGACVGNGGGISGSTIAANESNWGSGVQCGAGGTVQNCIVWDNTPSGESNIAGTDGTIRFTCSPGLVGDGNQGGNPLFLGGRSHRLQAHSPCIDAGHNAYAVGQTDLDGEPRLLDGAPDGVATVDMGCYELWNLDGDSDADGLTDGQETATYGTDPVDPHSDGDGHTDYQEILADTDPNDPGSCFRITDIVTNTPVRIYHTTSSNRVYSLQYRESLAPGMQWQPIADQSRIRGSGVVDCLTDATAGRAPQRLYRVIVSMP